VKLFPVLGQALTNPLISMFALKNASVWKKKETTITKTQHGHVRVKFVGSRKQLQLFEVLQKNKVPKPESKSILPWLLIKCSHPLGLEMRPFWQLIICHVSMQISSH